jgi:tetratricopeptide (TPR) repeat protein
MHQVIEFYEQNLQIAREMGDRRGEMTALGSLARAYDALNERDKAIGYFDLALKIAREIGDSRNERDMLKHLNAALNANEEKKEDPAQVIRKPRKKKGASATQSASKLSSRSKKA